MVAARLPGPVWAALALVAAGLSVFGLTLARYPDEGFHLLAAKLVNAGKVPYRDFFYQHAPLFPYVYAGWMRLAGETWRSAHLLSALLTTATIGLVADYVVSRQTRWRTAMGVLAVVLLALSTQLFMLGTVGHPYALALFLGVLAFRLAIRGCRTGSGGVTLLAGLASGGAALASLLVAPLVPVIAIGILAQDGPLRRSARLAYFAGGLAVWLLPLTWLFVEAPRPMLFDVVQYHLFYRGPSYRAPPTGAFREGLDELWLWLRSGEGLPRTLLAIVGIGSLFARPAAGDPRRAELALAAGIAVALALFLCLPYPTIYFYFIVILPFLCLLACAGLGSLARTRWFRSRPGLLFLAVAVVVTVFFLRAANGNHKLFEDAYWADIEEFAAQIDRIEPAGAPVYIAAHNAAYNVYFVARGLPPAGLENGYGSDLELPAGVGAVVNVIPQSRIDQWIREGRFAAVWMEAGDPRIAAMALDTMYAKRTRRSLPVGYDGLLFSQRIR